MSFRDRFRKSAEAGAEPPGIEHGSLNTTNPPGSTVTGAAFATLGAMLGGRNIAPQQDDDFDYQNPDGTYEHGSL